MKTIELPNNLTAIELVSPFTGHTHYQMIDENNRYAIDPNDGLPLIATEDSYEYILERIESGEYYFGDTQYNS
jgi:hypothetical protein